MSRRDRTRLTGETRLTSGQGVRTYASMRKHSRQGSAGGTGGTGGADEHRAVWIVLAVAGVILGLVLAFFLVRCIVVALSAVPDESEVSSEPAEVQSEVDGELSSGTFSYELEQISDGQWAIVRIETDGSRFVMATLAGEPVALMRHEGIILVPENTSEGWDIAALALIDQTEVSYVADASGEKITGVGTLLSAELDEGILRVSYGAEGIEESLDIAL